MIFMHQITWRHKPEENIKVWSQSLYRSMNGMDYNINLLVPELFFLILAHPVYKMWIIQEPNTLEL